MLVTRLFRPRLPRENFHERRLAAHQEMQGGMHRFEVLEGVHSLGAGAKLAWRLRPAQQQGAEHGNLMAVEIVKFVEPVLEFGDPGIAGGGADERLLGERAQGLAHRIFLKRHHRVAVRFLIARVDQSVQGERVVFGRGVFFFDQRAKHADFNFGELLGHLKMIAGALSNSKPAVRRILGEIWCGRVDSNHHGIATASPSSWCVCQFRHDRTEVRTSL